MSKLVKPTIFQIPSNLRVFILISSIFLKILILGGSGDYLHCFVAFLFWRTIYGNKSE